MIDIVGDIGIHTIIIVLIYYCTILNLTIEEIVESIFLLCNCLTDTGNKVETLR